MNAGITFANDSSINVLEKTGHSNGIFFSRLTGIHSKKIFRNFSIKYVIDGYEYYKLNGVEYKINQGELLVAGKDPGGEVYFDSHTAVKGLCIDIAEDTIKEAIAVLTSTGSYDFDNNLCSFFSYPYFFEHVYKLGDTLIATEINELICLKSLQKEDEFISKCEEWYLSLAEKIVLQELGFSKSLNGIHTIKYGTKKELLRRLLIGRDYIDSVYLNNPSIKEIARVCFLSEFHFFRSFREAFGMTPYKYMMEKRLTYACALIKQNTGFLNVAAICGFPDVFTFTKAFKRKMNLTPSEFRKVTKELYQC